MRTISSSARLGRVGDVRGVENADERDVLVVGVRHVHAGCVEESAEQARPHAPTPSARRDPPTRPNVQRATRQAASRVACSSRDERRGTNDKRGGGCDAAARRGAPLSLLQRRHVLEVLIIVRPEDEVDDDIAELRLFLRLNPLHEVRAVLV